MISNNSKKPLMHRVQRGVLSRRALLRAAGVSLSLPLLDVMSAQSSAAAPRRMFGICNNLGLLPGDFFPADPGPGYTPSPYLKTPQKNSWVSSGSGSFPSEW
jgi:hypothetical protein